MKYLSVLLSLFACSPAVAAEKIYFTTEDYPPYNFRVGDAIKGAGYDQVQLIMQDIGIDYEIAMMPWARAIALAQSEPMHCVFTAAHIPERDKLFKWIEPIDVGRNFMVAAKDSGVKVTSVEDSKSYIVGTQRNDYTQTLLEQQGFTKIDLATDLKLTLKKLTSGRIDLMPISEQHYVELVERGEPVEAQYVFTQQTFAIACNKDLPEALHQKMQAALDRLIAEGTQARLFEQYALRYTDFGQSKPSP